MRNTIFVMLTLALILIMPLHEPVAAQRGGRPQKADRRIAYHDGPVMTGPQNLYFIWYGCWTCGLPGSDPETVNLLTHFATSLGGSPYALINTTYPNGSGLASSGGLVFGGGVADLYPYGSVLTDAEAGALIAGAIDNLVLPLDPRGIYVILLSSDVTIPGLSDGRCQFHQNFTRNVYGSPVKFGVITNPLRAPSICAPQFAHMPSPNDNVAFDAMASWLAHLLNGTISNPTGSGWYDRYGLENSDKCQGTYGDTYALPNGSRANMQLGGRHLLIQQNWVNIGKGYCGLHL